MRNFSGLSLLASTCATLAGLSPALYANEKPDVSTLPPVEFREEKTSDVKIGPLTIKNLNVGVPIRIDDAFAKKWENNPPEIPFQLTAPKNDQILFQPGGKKTGAPELLKITLADEAKKNAIEIVRFSNISIPIYDDPKDRHKLCAKTIQTKVLPMVFNGMEQPKVHEVYWTRIDECDSVVFHCECFNPAAGVGFFVKLVGILPADQPGGILYFNMANRDLSEIKAFEDLRSKGVGQKILHSVSVGDVKAAGKGE